MINFTLTDARNRHGEVFDEATAKPVMLTKNGRPSHVILSVRLFRDFMARMNELEDRAFGEKAREALATDSFVGPDVFAAELKAMIANVER